MVEYFKPSSIYIEQLQPLPFQGALGISNCPRLVRSSSNERFELKTSHPLSQRKQTFPMGKYLAQRVRCSFLRSHVSTLQKKVIQTLQAFAIFSKALQIDLSLILNSLVKRYEKLGSNESNFDSEYGKI